MNIEIHPADWGIPYPERCRPEHIPEVLLPLTQVEHDWEAIPWHLSRSLMELLDTPSNRFDYLHLTKFCRARAAMLVLTGHVLDRDSTFSAMSRHRMQIGGIYRRHFLIQLQTFLVSLGYAHLPDCEINEVTRILEFPEIEKRRMAGKELIALTEREFLKTLAFISDADDMEEEVARHSVGFWVNGAEMPKPVNVHVRVKRHDHGHDLLPCRNEVKQLINSGSMAHKIQVRPQGKMNLDDPADTRPCHADGMTTPKNGVRPTARVIGDFNVIVMPNGRKINLSVKHKGRAFLQFIHQRLTKTGTSEFYDEEMRAAFNAQFSMDLAHRQWRSDRFRDDLFRGKEHEFDLLFETLDKGAGHYRLRVIFELPNSDQNRVG